jgi:hypothetical protein
MLADSRDAMQCNRRRWCRSDARGHPCATPSCHGLWLPHPRGTHHWQMGLLLQDELGLQPAAFQHRVHRNRPGPLIQRPLHHALQPCLQTSIYSSCSRSAVIHVCCWLHDAQVVQSPNRPTVAALLSPQVSIWNASIDRVYLVAQPAPTPFHCVALRCNGLFNLDRAVRLVSPI